MDKEAILNKLDEHDVEYRSEVLIDGEVIRTVQSADFEIVSSDRTEQKLNDAVNEYIIDELAGSEEDYYDRHSRELV